MIQPVRAVVWLVEGTWQGCLDASAQIIPPDARRDTPSRHALRCRRDHRSCNRRNARSSLSGAQAHRPFRGGRGRGGLGDPGSRGNAARTGGHRACSSSGTGGTRGRRAAADGVDLLVVARDGDRSRLGPHSLGHATRFIVDHAPCPVLLVWPDEPPGLESIPAAHGAPSAAGWPPQRESITGQSVRVVWQRGC